MTQPPTIPLRYAASPRQGSAIWTVTAASLTAIALWNAFRYSWMTYQSLRGGNRNLTVIVGPAIFAVAAAAVVASLIAVVRGRRPLRRLPLLLASLLSLAVPLVLVSRTWN